MSDCVTHYYEKALHERETAQKQQELLLQLLATPLLPVDVGAVIAELETNLDRYELAETYLTWLREIMIEQNKVH